jgi:protein phosphatase
MLIRLNQPFALNETGGGQRNEDSIFPEKGKATTDDRCFLVCDGIGGHRSGDVASRTVCNAFEAFLKKTDLRHFSEATFEQALAQAVKQLDSVDADSAEQFAARKKMGTTLTFVCFHPRGVFMAHIGDSRIYHLRKQGGQVGILYRSQDHSLVNELIRAEIITPEEALTHPKRNVITRALIERQQKQPKADIHETDDVRAGDYFFLCSDGILEQVSDEILCDIIARETGDDAKISAIYKACQGRSHDNFSAWLIPVAEVFDEPETVPAEDCDRTTTPVADTAPPPAKRNRKRIWL